MPSAAEAELTQRGEHLVDGRADPRPGAAGSTPAASDDIGVDSEGGDLGGETSVLVGTTTWREDAELVQRVRQEADAAAAGGAVLKPSWSSGDFSSADSSANAFHI
jgi:hypothetical protein